MFAFIEHGQPHNHHGGENTITLSHASVRRPCQKLTKSLTSQVRASKIFPLSVDGRYDPPNGIKIQPYK